MLELKQITLEKQGRSILGPLDLDIRGGELLTIIGANGAGKSSLLSILCGLESDYRGDILSQLDDQKTADGRRLARQRALMPQFHALNFDFRVKEVVALGRNPHHGECTHQQHQHYIEQAMSLAGVDTLAERSYTRLSGGQQARVQFARVLAQLSCGEGDARLLLLDEPTASLDLRCQIQLMACLRDLCDKGLGAVAVLHDINLAARFADRIALLDGGHLLALGSPETVLTESLLEQAFQLPVHIIDNALPNRRLVAV